MPCGASGSSSGVERVLLSGTIRVCFGIAIRPKDAVATVARCANEDQGRQKYQTASCARFALYEESEEVQDHEHDMIVKECRVDRLRDEQYWDQPLEAVHQAAVVAEPLARQQPSTLDDDPAVVVCNSDFKW